jgi:anthranilate phosphoribosyltransferase
MMFRQIFEKIYSKQDLTIEESRHALLSMMNGEAEPPQISAFLTALHMKGESAEELAGFALAMREKSVAVPLDGRQTMDTCGTGGDRKGSFNISTLAAFVVAGCGVPVVKHGNRASSSACGSADLIEALGVRFRLKPEEIAESLDYAGFAFVFAPDYHPATMHVAKIRKQLGVPTLFNLLGPLTNPARPSAQLVGVYERRAVDLMASASKIIDPHRRVSFVHAAEGWDEATPNCDFILHPPSGKASWISPRLFGFSSCIASDLNGGSPEENAKIAMSVLDGEPGPRRETVLLNAALSLMVFYPQFTDQEALQAAEHSLNSGSAKNVVIRLKQKYPERKHD